MKKRELKKLHDAMSDYGYFEPHIYPSKGELIMFIDETRFEGNPVVFDSNKKEFTVTVFAGEDVDDYKYESVLWDEDITALQKEAYEAVQLARDLAKNRKRDKY